MDNIINIILILLLVNTGLRILFKIKSTTLNCGIWAWAGVAPKSFNKVKFNTLGISNEDRGTDSCGVTVDGEIQVGIQQTRKYRDFVRKTGFDNPVEFPVVIGHTRKGPIGTYTIANAHPFGFGNNEKDKSKYAFLGVHNGTLHNHKDLAEEYKVATEKHKMNSKNSYYKVDKIDSEILLECIYRSKSFKVLSKYNGAAAIIFYNTNEPKTIYCFKGESDSASYYHHGTEEERPLYAYQEHKNSLYLSSQKEGLELIGGNDDNITDLDTNTVYKIKNGNLETAEKFPVSRINQQIKKETTVSNYNKKTGKEQETYNLYDDDYYGGVSHFAERSKEKVGDIFNVTQRNNYFGFGGKKKEKYVHIMDDAVDIVPSDRVYVEALRYKRTGHFISGVHVWVENYGFFYLGTNSAEAKKFFWSLVGKKFVNGEFRKKSFDPKGKPFSIPFESKIGYKAKKNVNFETLFHYFFEGARIKTELDYMSLLNFKKIKHQCTMSSFSNATKDPVFDIKGKRGDDNKQGIYYNGTLADDTFCPMGSSKIYIIKKGNCVGIEKVYGKNNNSAFSNLKLLKNSLEDNEHNIQEKEKNIKDKSFKAITKNSLTQVESAVIAAQERDKKKEESKIRYLKDSVLGLNSNEKNIEEEEVDQRIDKIFLAAMKQAQKGVDELAEFIDTEQGSTATDILNNFLLDCSELTASEIHTK